MNLTDHRNKPPLEDVIEHYGVLGMKWGVRRSDEELARARGTRKVRKEAAKDAKEFARAKAFYGEGAGTRRKLIKAKVEGKSKKMPGYKEEFERQLESEDTEKHANKAIRERKRKDVKNTTAKTARGIKNVALGNAQAASLAAIVIVSGAKFVRDLGVDKQVVSAIKDYQNKRQTESFVEQMFKNSY